jgi:Asp-tRNA(Asn)/Glu-tRNA(Gln) amidotransferase A subunit family amidase
VLEDLPPGEADRLKKRLDAFREAMDRLRTNFPPALEDEPLLASELESQWCPSASSIRAAGTPPPRLSLRDSLRSPCARAEGSIREVSSSLARFELTSEELVRSHLERAQALSDLNAFISLLPEDAIAEARRLDEMRRRGEVLGPLHGIPVTAKDLIWSKGVRTTSGSKIDTDFVPDRDAPALASLRAQGAVLLGKTNLHEFAYGVSNVNPHYGAARNPWDRTRISGGSSGGSAVALACGVGYGSIGTDTGGSIRIPSALCGIVGLKPTYGRLSREGATPLSWSLDHVGPMARSVEDVAVLYEAMSGDAIELPEGSESAPSGV